MTNWAEKKIAIVCGGRSSEREVSLRTGAAFERALGERGIRAVSIDLVPERVRELVSLEPDVVLNAMHGQDGEDGRLQGLLEMLGIPYTGSGVAASAVAMDKVMTKCVFSRFGIPTPAWEIAETDALGALSLSPPFVVKASLEGSSVGVRLVREDGDWDDAIAEVRRCRGRALVEAFVSGRELTVGVFDGESMGVVAIEAAEGFYDYAAKYARTDTRYETSALEPEVRELVTGVGLAAYRALGCRGVARVDVMIDAAGDAWALEVNTVPGMTETSLVPKLAAARGEAFPDFVLRLLDSATTDAAMEAR